MKSGYQWVVSHCFLKTEDHSIASSRSTDGVFFFKPFPQHLFQVPADSPAVFDLHPENNGLTKQGKPGVDNHQTVGSQQKPPAEGLAGMFQIGGFAENAQAIANQNQTERSQQKPFGAGTHPLDESPTGRFRGSNSHRKSNNK